MVSENEKNRLYECYIRCLLCNIALLLSDAAAWSFKGETDRFGYVVVSIENFLVIISQFNQMYYIIDSGNIYRRCRLFWLSQVWGIIGMALNGALVVRYRKYMDRRGVITLLSYIALSVATMLIQIFIYGVALLNTATSIALLSIFMMMQVETAELLREKEHELEQSRVELKVSLQKAGVSYILKRERNFLAIDPSAFTCDSYAFMNGDIRAINSYRRDYMI